MSGLPGLMVILVRESVRGWIESLTERVAISIDRSTTVRIDRLFTKADWVISSSKKSFNADEEARDESRASFDFRLRDFYFPIAIPSSASSSSRLKNPF